MKKGNKSAWLFIFYGAITVAVLVAFLGANDFGAIFGVLAQANYKYVLFALVLTLAYFVLTPLSTCVLARARKLDVGLGTVYAIGCTEHFFNGITPFATGGQPFQMYEFSRAKIKVAESTGVLLMNFIIMMVASNSFALVSLVYFNDFIAGNVPLLIIAVIGFCMNFFVLIFMVLIATSKRVGGALISLAVWACKLPFLKGKIEGNLPKLEEYIANMQSAFKGLLKNVGATMLALALKVITLAVYYSITFYLLLALGVDVGYGDIFFIICGTSFAITAVVFLPTPGSAGGIEFAFGSIFSSLAGGLSQSVATGGMLIWRLLTYYVLMLLSLAFYVGLEIYFNVKSKREREKQSV